METRSYSTQESNSVPSPQELASEYQTQAMVYTKYGSPDVLQLKEVEKPTPKDDEVLIKVHAASLNAAELHLVRGKPFLVRLMGLGLLKPKHTIPGAAIAGRVEAVGRNVTQFQPGDEVFGDLSACGWGGFAEYVCASEDALALKPAESHLRASSSRPASGSHRPAGSSRQRTDSARAKGFD